MGRPTRGRIVSERNLGPAVTPKQVIAYSFFAFVLVNAGIIGSILLKEPNTVEENCKLFGKAYKHADCEKLGYLK